ncbi:MAG: hypothetical protein FWG92_01600 [Leptospirales bacterium]|nr:hypothetical protein [Leptospirales bacterium]
MNAVPRKPYAMILAGYDKFDTMTKRKHKKEIREAYGEDIFLGENKFLYAVAGKPIIQYVIDSVYNAKENGERIYDKIYIYNDIKTITKAIDLTKYDNIVLRQMTNSVAGHWKDIYGLIDYGQRVDTFFGDTPRITTEDVEYAYKEFSGILGKKHNHRGTLIYNIFSIVELTDMTDNWLEHRNKYIKRGKNKGKLKNFVGFKGFQARVGNLGSFVKHATLDNVIESEVLNYLYNLRKALTPSAFSRIIYYMWKAKKFNIITQIKNRSIDILAYQDAATEIIENVLKINLSEYGGLIFHIKKNASHWENDIDSLADLMVFQKRLSKQKTFIE